MSNKRLETLQEINSDIQVPLKIAMKFPQYIDEEKIKFDVSNILSLMERARIIILIINITNEKIERVVPNIDGISEKGEAFSSGAGSVRNIDNSMRWKINIGNDLKENNLFVVKLDIAHDRIIEQIKNSSGSIRKEEDWVLALDEIFREQIGAVVSKIHLMTFERNRDIDVDVLRSFVILEFIFGSYDYILHNKIIISGMPIRAIIFFILNRMTVAFFSEGNVSLEFFSFMGIEYMKWLESKIQVITKQMVHFIRQKS